MAYAVCPSGPWFSTSLGCSFVQEVSGGKVDMGVLAGLDPLVVGMVREPASGRSLCKGEGRRDVLGDKKKPFLRRKASRSIQP